MKGRLQALPIVGAIFRWRDVKPDGGERFTAAEGALIATYRRLPPKYQRRLRAQADEFATLARATRSTKKS